MFRIESIPGLDVVTGSASDMLALLDTATIPEQNKKRHADGLQRYESQTYRAPFGGLSSATEAAAIFRESGWQDGATRARAEIPMLPLADLTPEAVAMKRRRAFAEEGDTLRVEQALAGNWESAYETRRKRSTRTPVTLSIGCAFGGNAGISHEAMFWCGLQMAAICDLLEGAGWRIELRALKANDFGRGRIHCQDWRVKDADQPLRMDTTLALFGHAGVYRCFGWLANNASTYTTPENYGHVIDGEPMRKAFTKLAIAGAIAPLSLIVPPAYNRDAAVQNMRNALQSVRTLATGAAA